MLKAMARPFGIDLLLTAALLSCSAAPVIASPSRPSRPSTAAAARFTVEDYLEIQQLYARYAHALDLGEGEAFAATFVQDGEFTSGRAPGKAAEVRTPLKGHDNLVTMGSRGGSRHFTANLVITPTGDGGAKASCYLLLYNVRAIPAAFVETAIYNDTLVKTAQGWKFKSRVVWRDDDDISPFKPKPRAP